jgi:hypothetical protein
MTRMSRAGSASVSLRLSSFRTSDVLRENLGKDIDIELANHYFTIFQLVLVACPWLPAYQPSTGPPSSRALASPSSTVLSNGWLPIISILCSACCVAPRVC